MPFYIVRVKADGLVSSDALQATAFSVGIPKWQVVS